MTNVNLGIKPAVVLVAIAISAAFLVSPWFLLVSLAQVLVSCILIGYKNLRP